MNRTLLEQETIILYNQAEAAAEVYTHDPTLLAKLERLSLSHPRNVVRINSNTYKVPKRCVSVREPYSEARRTAASEHAKKTGRTPPIRGKRSQTE